MANINNQIEPGQIKFLKAALPPLAAGDYRVTIEQNLTNVDKEGNAAAYQKSSKFHVSAPRFDLDNSIIYNKYPPSNSEGSYFYTLPHIVFSRKTLPWERTIDGQPLDENNIRPWLALLMLDEDEIKEYELEVESLMLKNALTPEDPSVFFPPVQEADLDPWLKEQYNASPSDKNSGFKVLDLPVGLFQEITPYKEDLQYLAHARQVDTGDKEMAGINASGWFSVVICNRLPTKGKRNTVFLVSLEGYQDKIGEGASFGNHKKLRLSVLANWSFTAKGLDFDKLVEDLNEGADLYKVKPDPTLSLSGPVKTALEFGYVPLNHKMRQGSKTVSWYRGPLVPVNQSKPGNLRFDSADAALRYNQETGLFDVSYSSAWQLGRLMALKNKTFSKALKLWNSQFERDFILDWAQNLLKEEYQDVINFTDDPDDDGNPDNDFSNLLDLVEKDDLLKNLIIENWIKHEANQNNQ